ncbi:FIG00761799: membrane protein [[Actinomadura] parvosata subsp. kistnae]|uniref:ABC transporter permease n=1 Tax=[Actinomadura] parvosata subsp. kistnae TaxID=1909395 RepID=A0A1V0A9Q9_9ACTN|nr:ABC transporter permease [Nonomuraea sp. ATCC 55076]AQZ66882.1 ABC transporter permease [Nonomuraea sp. ATCC 55076]SPL94971.1 FIG00761799: membrane protein [Actinomadura parvosata subsp. kistnae]
MSEIYDIGYRHYDGPRLGRAYATRALAVHSLRGVFGIGRPARSKIVPFALAAIMIMPSIVGIAMMALVKQRGIPYSGFAVVMQAVVAIFLAAQAPTVVAPDLRYRVLPLYLSRPVSITEYVGAKVAAMTVAVFALIAVPLTVTYLGELIVDMPGPPATGEYLGAVLMAFLLALLLAAFGLALASFTPRRGLGVASVITVYLLSSASVPIIYGTLYSSGNESAAAWAWLANPFWLVDSVQHWLFGTTPHSIEGAAYPSGPASAAVLVLLIAAGLAALALRYRKAAAR